MRGIEASVKVLSESEIQAVHDGSLEILEKTGVRVPNDECLDSCERAGAVVDRVTSVVRIPSTLMEELIRLHRPIDTAGNDTLEKLHGFISTQVFVVDYETRNRRYGLLDDLLKGIALVEHLDNITSCSAVTVPSDVPHAFTDVVSHQLIYKYSSKPGGTYILSPVSARYIIAMADAAGQQVGYLLDTVSPLQFSKDSLDMTLVFARAGQPISIGPMVMGAATGPVTVAGTIALQNAETLASKFLVYALTGNWGRGYSGGAHSVDLRSLLCSFGSPNQALIGICAAQMAAFYGLETGSNSGLTDALMPDFQGGFEKASNAVFACLAGNKGIGAQGIVGADQGFSFEQLALDNEWLGAYNYLLNGVEVNAETIASDLINSVGIGGTFMGEEHTARHSRDSYWPSRMFLRESWDAWQSRGRSSLLERAHEFVESVTHSYRSPVPVVSAEQAAEIDRLAECAKKELT